MVSHAMSMKPLGNVFAGELHRRVLKPRGFAKAARTFTRKHADYIEVIQIQGSNWNSDDEVWSFYVNILASFHDIPFRDFSVGPRYHASGRLHEIVPEAPSAFDLTALNMNDLVVEIGHFSAEAGERLPKLLIPVRERANSGLLSFIPL
jgi:hypothetical protein